MTKLQRVLVANRGEIAVRILRACFDEGIGTVVALSSVDLDSLPAHLADRVICVGAGAPSQSYLNTDAMVMAAVATGCDALHPGYGFLSERPELAECCARNGVTFIGPSPDVLRRGGDKVAARELAGSIGIPLVASSGDLASVSEATAAAVRVGYPVLLKAAAGGGGRGMTLVSSPVDIEQAYDQSSFEALQAFGDGRLYVESYVVNARHVEVQVIADQFGRIVHLGERDCSCQRRYQKLVEEAPAPQMETAFKTELYDAAVSLALAMNYVGAGTVEFVVDQDRGTYSFLEINTRIQVEHPVTEMVTGVDVVREQLRIAAGEPLGIRQGEVQVHGHALECRINAERPHENFIPAPGRIERWVVPQGSSLRVDTHCFPGYEVSPLYDSLLAKVIVRGDDRHDALAVMERALMHLIVQGIDTTRDLHLGVVTHPDFKAGGISTRWMEERFLPAWVNETISKSALLISPR